MINYRCPKCGSLHSVGVDKIFDGRLIFRCSKCNICALVIAVGGGTDEAYLEFLDRCESGTGIAYADDLKLLMQQEKIIRAPAEIDALMAAATATGDPLLEQTLRSQQDYIVDFQAIDDPPPELGSPVEDVPVDEAIINVLKAKKLTVFTNFKRKRIRKSFRETMW